MAEVFIAPTGALSKRSISDLRKAGVVVVETDRPDLCKFIRSTEVVSENDMLYAALKALNTTGGYGEDGKLQRETFTAEVFRCLSWTRKASADAKETPS